MTRTVNPATLNLHPQAALVPEMAADQYATFLADVRARGVLKPIELIPGTTCVIDGRTRLRAALDAKLPGVPVADADLAGDTPVVYMLRVAHLRRHLKPGQAAALAVEIKKQLAAAAKERQREGAAKGGSKTPNKLPEKVPEAGPVPVPAPAKKDRAGEAREIAAKMTGTNSKYVSQAEKVEAKSPEVFAQLKAGAVTLPEAVAAVKGTPGEIPLTAIPKFPAAAAEQLARHKVTTLDHVRDEVFKLRDRRKGDASVYTLLRELNVTGDAYLDAGDAVTDFVDPKTMLPVTKPAATPPAASAPALGPCPFCGKSEPTVAFVNALAKQVLCHNCGCNGPRASTEKAARAAWNKRAKK